MRFSVLGPLLVESDDGRTLLLKRPAQRSTLAVLLLHHRRPLTKTQLIDALWGETPPGDADAALRVRITDLRRALQVRDRLLTHHPGYRMRVEPGESDVDTFSLLMSHGRAALDGDAVEDAARLLEQACMLWRDPPLADIPESPVMQLAATALLDQRRTVTEWLLDARLALGQHHEVLAQLRGMVAADPLSEHPHVQLMLALYRCGQKAAALDTYSKLRDTTVRELGQDPGPEARAMLGQILDDGPELKFRPRALAVSGQARPPWLPVRQLPAAVPDFTGRAAAIGIIARHRPANDIALTVITGSPGAGKTALAVKVAHLSSVAFRDGQLFVDLGGAGGGRSPLSVIAELLRSLGVQAARIPSGLAERTALYRSVLAGRKVLVVADDAASAAQVRPLLPGTPGCAVLVTSNSRLPDLEGAHRVAIAGLSNEESVALLAKVAGQDRIDAEPEAAAVIASACAGLPLALRIAGSRLAASPALRLAEFAAAVSDGARLLGELVVGDLSVSRRLDMAWLALDAYSRQVLRALADVGMRQLPSSVVLAATAGAPGLAQALMDASLLTQDPATGDYMMAPLADRHAAMQHVSATQ